MQTALNRLINKELTVKVEKKLETNTGWIFLAWLVAMVAPTFLIDYNSPWFLLFVLTICVSTDIGGYVIGKSFKGPKLTKFSPNKTYSEIGRAHV